ncbi:hypothetical protein [Streptomyces sp. A1136]|uniref:hypothetical protein n=1 Tax=Streptomyces sp. A1136 TaxID=2563102 RepID=UPI00109E6201|nr:hypothetical protein [Streptomyces sp. A1136]THA54263.1 hypothetical protein E6R62_17015 [Streptomyces sp. A1136]
MDAKIALKRLTNRATSTFEEAGAARKRLTDALAFQGAQLDGLMDAVLVAEGKAKPWMQLLNRIDRHGVREGLAKQREECLELLLHYGLSMSTSMVRNASQLAEQDGLRRFLDATDTIEIDEDAAPTETPAPELEPAVIGGLRTAVRQQVQVLEAIRGNGVKVHAAGKVTVEDGSAPRLVMVEFAISKGWAQMSNTGPASEGQPVTLTPAGEAILTN